MTAWILGIFVTALGVVGLILAKGAWDIGMTTFGIGLAVFAVWFDFWLLRLRSQNAKKAA